MIDLIIPMYNAEDTIARCLGSLIGQTKSRKFIITIVDDASTDYSADIIDRFRFLLPINYLKLDKNLGAPGLVRQYGIDHTHCDYIMFLDADDVLASTAAERATRATIQKRPDVIFSSFWGETGETDEYSLYSPNKITWLHGNVYSRKFLTDNNICFDDKMNEDGSFNLKCYWLAKNKMVIEEPLYYWMNNRKSLTRGNNNFLLDIAEDFINTYVDAIDFIVKKDSALLNDKIFQDTFAEKMSQFLEFCEGLEASKRDQSGAMAAIEKYVKQLKSYEIDNTKFVQTLIEKFNSFKIFVYTPRQHGLTYWLDKFNIPYEGVI